MKLQEMRSELEVERERAETQRRRDLEHLREELEEELRLERRRLQEKKEEQLTSIRLQVSVCVCLSLCNHILGANLYPKAS